MKKLRIIPKNSRPELIAPAGNLEKMKTAFAFGADAVYAGIPDFSLRVRINDFDMESLQEAVLYAHSLGKKIYITTNIFAHNPHLRKLPRYMDELKKMKVDGIIASDPGVIATIKKTWPKARIHLSTQANCTNWQAAKFWKKQGLKRVVLGREVSLAEVEEIKKKVPGIELETFVHGAMCMAYSGRCFLSKFFTNRSANLGDCVQSCRWKYEIKTEGHEPLELVEEKHGSYILNSKDLCLIKKIPELMEVKIDAFKIEGRAKSVYYLGSIVGAYRKAIDISHNAYRTTHSPALRQKKLKNELNFLYKELEEKLVNRGYTEGFMFNEGALAQNLENSHDGSVWEFCGQIVESRKKQKKYSTFIKVHNSLRSGDKIEIVCPGYDIIKRKAGKMFDAQSGQQVKEAHGGQNKIIIIETKAKVPAYSIVRRRVS